MAQIVGRTGFLCLAIIGASAAGNAATFQTIYSTTVNGLGFGFATPLAPTASGQIIGTISGNYQQPLSSKIMLLKPPNGGAGAWSGKTLFDFGNETSNIYRQPYAASLAPVGLVGATYGGGAGGVGGVYDLSKSTNPPLTTVHDFISNAEQGVGPLVKGPGGLFYGLGVGTAFSVDASALPASYAVLTTLPHTVQSSALVPNSTGQLFGSSVLGGAVDGVDGSVFQLSQTAGEWTAQTIYRFGNDATTFQLPKGTLAADASGNLYGCATNATGNGGVFKLTPSTGGNWTASVVYDFGSQVGEPSAGGSGSTGTSSGCSLTFEPSGKILGVSMEGGGDPAFNKAVGTVFELAPPAAGQTAWTETVLHVFSGGAADGGYPTGPAVRIGSSYYGASLFTAKPSTAWVWSVTP